MTTFLHHSFNSHAYFRWSAFNKRHNSLFTFSFLSSYVSYYKRGFWRGEKKNISIPCSFERKGHTALNLFFTQLITYFKKTDRNNVVVMMQPLMQDHVTGHKTKSSLMHAFVILSFLFSISFFFLFLLLLLLRYCIFAAKNVWKYAVFEQTNRIIYRNAVIEFDLVRI